jgi:hypothetical protein
MNVFKTILICLVILFLQSCSTKDLLEKIAPKDDEALARTTISELANENYHAVLKKLQPNLIDENTIKLLTQMRLQLPQGKATEIKLVNAFVRFQNAQKTSELVYQYNVSNSYALISISILTDKNIKKIYNFTTNKTPMSLEKQNAFSMQGKSLLAYVILVFSVIIPIFMVFTLVMLIRTPNITKKWLWGLFIIIGFSKLTIVWPTEAIGFQLLHFSLFGAGFFRQGFYGPWSIYIALPIGAIMFLVKRKRMLKLPSTLEA